LKPGKSTSTIPVDKWQLNDPRQLIKDRKLVLMIANDLLPYSFVESPSFENFLGEESEYNIPSRKHFVNSIIPSVQAAIRHKLQSKIDAASRVSLAIDIWTNRQMKSFIAVTGHAIVNFELISFHLSCKRIEGRHTADNVFTYYTLIIEEFNLRNKVHIVVSDNASNMLAAFNLPGFREVEDEEEEDHEEDCCCLEYLPENHKCFAHTLQLVIKDALKSSSDVRNLIATVASIVSFVRKSSIAADILEGEPRPQMANSTRWNSQLMMIRSILKIDRDKLDSLETTKLTSRNRLMIEDLITILTPFEEVTNEIQGEKVVTVSLVIPAILGLQTALDVSEYHQLFVNELKRSLERRMQHYLENLQYQRATILDPRIKFQCFRSEQISILKEDLINLMNGLNLPNAIGFPGRSSGPIPKKKSCIFYFLNEQNITLSPAAREIDCYISETYCHPDSNPLEFWKSNEEKFPRLSKLAQYYFCTPASSAPVERTFSIGGKIFRPERCNLTDDNFETLMFIKCNQSMQ